MGRIDRLKLLHYLRNPYKYAGLSFAQQMALLGPALGDYRGLTPDLLATYRDLSVEEGRELAKDTIDLWKADPGAYQGWMEEILLHLTCLVPGSLTGLHGALIDGKLSYHSDLFRDADGETRDRFIRMVETEPYGFTALCNLAYVGDEVVQAAFHRWRQSPPSEDDIPARIEDACRTAGWELTEAGGRRHLYHSECYALVSADTVPAGDMPGPVGVVTPHEEKCRWCGQPLVTLFDINLEDERVAFLAPRWRRLRIATCDRCACFGTVATEVDGDGSSHWSDLNNRPEYIGDDDSGWDLPERRLVLGPQRRSPHEAHMFVLTDGGSQIGGFPMWMGSEPHPDCLKCGRAMVFVGELQMVDIKDAEGVFYGFLCQDCGMAATTYAQT